MYQSTKIRLIQVVNILMFIMSVFAKNQKERNRNLYIYYSITGS